MKLPTKLAAGLRMTFAVEGKAAVADAEPNRLLEATTSDDPFEIAGRELATGSAEPGAWARALVAADGDVARSQAEYVRIRVSVLQEQAAKLEAVARAEEAERDRVDQMARDEHESRVRAWAGEQGVAIADAARMWPFRIAKVGDRFVYREYRYERLEDAVAYASKLESKPG
ncbi:hypothetical protein [Phenylobacterium sp.]|uniref:hypothetical protein n=1 Tax=Phenylobacterium sp. TaxID=1871053 RepID=UPI0035B2175B